MFSFYKRMAEPSFFINACGTIPTSVAENLYGVALKKYFEEEYGEASRPSVIGVGSGAGVSENYLKNKTGLAVTCYDNDPLSSHVLQATFPIDNAKILPEDCSNTILFSAYPQGYLGELLKLYIERGGNKLCVIVEYELLCHMHAGFEPDGGDLLKQSLFQLVGLTEDLEDPISESDFPSTVACIGGEVIRRSDTQSLFLQNRTNIIFYGNGWNHDRLSTETAKFDRDYVLSAYGEQSHHRNTLNP